MRSPQLYALAARRADEATDQPDYLPDAEPLPPIRLGAWARWMAERDVEDHAPSTATRSVQRARIGRPAREAATDAGRTG